MPFTLAEEILFVWSNKCFVPLPPSTPKSLLSPHLRTPTSHPPTQSWNVNAQITLLELCSMCSEAIQSTVSSILMEYQIVVSGQRGHVVLVSMLPSNLLVSSKHAMERVATFRIAPQQEVC